MCVLVMVVSEPPPGTGAEGWFCIWEGAGAPSLPPTTTTSSSSFLLVYSFFFFFFLVRLVRPLPSPHPATPNSPRRHMVRVIAETSGPPQGALLSPVHLFQTGPHGTLVLSRGPRWLGIGPSKRFRFRVDCFAARWAVGRRRRRPPHFASHGAQSYVVVGAHVGRLIGRILPRCRRS